MMEAVSVSLSSDGSRVVIGRANAIPGNVDIYDYTSGSTLGLKLDQ